MCVCVGVWGWTIWSWGMDYCSFWCGGVGVSCLAGVAQEGAAQTQVVNLLLFHAYDLRRVRMRACVCVRARMLVMKMCVRARACGRG